MLALGRHVLDTTMALTQALTVTFVEQNE